MNPIGFDFDPTVCHECGHVHDHHSPLDGHCANPECGSKELKTAVSRQVWLEQTVALIKSQHLNNFIIGDRLNYGRNNFGTGYLEAQKVYGLGRPHLWNVASICNRVAASRRREYPLTFSHHEAIAHLPPAEQVRYLSLALEKTLAVAQLRAHVRQTGRSDEVKELPENTETASLTAWFAAGIRLLRSQEPKTWSPERRQAFREQWTRLSMAAEPLLMGQ